MNQRIKRIRNNVNLTQQEFAKKIGTSQNVLANWESGRRNPSASVINNICKTFGINEDWLRDGTGEMFIPDPLNELDALIEKYSLSSADRVLIEKYVNLKAESRETIIHFITDVVSTLSSKNEVKIISNDKMPQSEEELLAESVIEPSGKVI